MTENYSTEQFNEITDLAELNYLVAELLYDTNSKVRREAVLKAARTFVKEKGWLEEEYEIPNMNGLGRPLTRAEDLEIINNDMRRS